MIADPFSVDFCFHCLGPVTLEDPESLIEGNQSMMSSRTILPETSLSPRLLVPRLVWLCIGPALLMILVVLRLEAPQADSRLLHALFAAVVSGILAARWISWLLGDRRDSFGFRIRRTGVVSYTALVVFFTGALWVLVELVARQAS